jgi:hypothetical protein
MQNEWLYIGLFILVGLFFPAAAIILSWLISPKKPNPIKSSTYECGIETVGPNWVQFKAQYYIFALVFLVFDVETVFLLGGIARAAVPFCGRRGDHLHPDPDRRTGLYLAKGNAGVGVDHPIRNEKADK